MEKVRGSFLQPFQELRGDEDQRQGILLQGLRGIDAPEYGPVKTIRTVLPEHECVE